MTRQEIFSKIAGGVSSTTFLTGMGITGTITTAFFAGRGGMQAARLIATEEAQLPLDPDNLDGTPELDLKEKAKLVWPCFVPAASMGVTTIIAIVLSNHEASKKVAALTTAAGVSERALAEYKNKVSEKLTKPKQTEVRDQIAQDRINNHPPGRDVIITDGGDVLCYDMMTDRYFLSSVEKIRQAQNDINVDIIHHMFASLNAFYDRIGIRTIPYGDEVGWNGDSQCHVQFSTVMSPDQRPCICVDFEIPPFLGYNNLHG